MERLAEFTARALLLRPRWWIVAPILAMAIALVTVVRVAVDDGRAGFLFSPYLPIIMLAALLCGWRQALFAMLGSALAVRLAFLEPGWVFNGQGGYFAVLAGFLLTMGLIVFMAEAMRAVVQRSTRIAQEMETFNAELVHRSKNAMQLMVGMVQRGLTEPDMADYFNKLPPRLMAWGRAGELLRYGVLPACDLAELMDRVLSPFPQERIEVSGCAVQVDRSVASSIAMSLHELATNACKYGALSNAVGRVLIDWRRDDTLVCVTWTEVDGPAVAPPVREGFGTKLLQRQRAFSNVAIDFRPAGLCAQLTFSCASVEAG